MSPLGYYSNSTATASNYTFSTAGTATIDTSMYFVKNGWIVPQDIVYAVPPPQPVRWAPREFNKYINASDLLEEFIAYLGTEHVRQGEVLKLPMDLFVKWLIIRACEQDGEEPDVILQLPAPKKQPRCIGCGRYMAHDVLMPLHDERCARFHFRRAA